MIPILKSIGAGIVNGFPLIQSIAREIRKAKGGNAPLPVNDSASADAQTPAQAPGSFNVVAVIAEIATVALIWAFVSGKITIDELMQLVGIVKPK